MWKRSRGTMRSGDVIWACSHPPRIMGGRRYGIRSRQEQPRLAPQSVQIVRGAEADRVDIDLERRRRSQPCSIQPVSEPHLRSALRDVRSEREYQGETEGHGGECGE